MSMPPLLFIVVRGVGERYPRQADEIIKYAVFSSQFGARRLSCNTQIRTRTDKKEIWVKNTTSERFNRKKTKFHTLLLVAGVVVVVGLSVESTPSPRILLLKVVAVVVVVVVVVVNLLGVVGGDKK